MVPQGINPRELLVELTWTEAPDKGGMQSNAIAVLDVEYKKKPSPVYDAVVIVNCGMKRIPVEIVS